MIGALRRQTSPGRDRMATETEPVVMSSQAKEKLLFLELEEERQNPFLEA